MFYSILQHRDRDQAIQSDADAELEAARQEADSFSFGPRQVRFNTRGNVMETQSERDQADCTVVRKQCGCACMMCVTEYIDRETKKEIGEAVADGCTVEHMTATEARKQEWACSNCDKTLPQVELFELAP